MFLPPGFTFELLSIVFKLINSHFQSLPRNSVLQIMEANFQMVYNYKRFELKLFAKFAFENTEQMYLFGGLSEKNKFETVGVPCSNKYTIVTAGKNKLALPLLS